MQKYSELIELIDTIKEKISDKEYLDICNTLKSLNTVKRLDYELTIIFPVAKEIKDNEEDGYSSSTDKIQLSMESITFPISLRQTVYVSKFLEFEKASLNLLIPLLEQSSKNVVDILHKIMNVMDQEFDYEIKDIFLKIKPIAWGTD